MRVLTTLKCKGGLATAESLGAFVNAVCNNVLFEAYRAHARVTPLEDGHEEPDEASPSAEAVLIGEEDRSRVLAAMTDLPARDKDLLRWLFFENRDKDQVCRELNVDRSYLRVLLHRAKIRFREAFLRDESVIA